MTYSMSDNKFFKRRTRQNMLPAQWWAGNIKPSAQTAKNAFLYVLTEHAAAYGCYRTFGFIETEHPGKAKIQFNITNLTS